MAAGSADIFDAAAVMTVPGYLIKQALQHDADQSKLSWKESVHNTSRQRSASHPRTRTYIGRFKSPGKQRIALERVHAHGGADPTADRGQAEGEPDCRVLCELYHASGLFVLSAAVGHCRHVRQLRLVLRLDIGLTGLWEEDDIGSTQDE